jgi:hypothetical protein
MPRKCGDQCRLPSQKTGHPGAQEPVAEPHLNQAIGVGIQRLGDPAARLIHSFEDYGALRIPACQTR